MNVSSVKVSDEEWFLLPNMTVSWDRVRRVNPLRMLMEKELTDVGRERDLRCTTSLSSIFVSLPASCHLSLRSPGRIPGLRGTLLYGAPNASAGLHYDVRCWHTTMTQCVQRRRKLRTGVGVCSPRPAGHSEFCNHEPAYGMRRTCC